MLSLFSIYLKCYLCFPFIKVLCLQRIGEKRILLNNILHRKTNWIGHILRRNCLLKDAFEGQLMKGVGRDRVQLLDYLRNRTTYWELKEEAED